jgi:hypothetical protein
MKTPAQLPPPVTFQKNAVQVDGLAWAAAIRAAPSDADALSLIAALAQQAVCAAHPEAIRAAYAQWNSQIENRVKVLMGKAYAQGRAEAGTHLGLSTDPAAPAGSLMVNLDERTSELLRDLIARPITIANTVEVEVPSRTIRATQQRDGSVLMVPQD